MPIVVKHTPSPLSMGFAGYLGGYGEFLKERDKFGLEVAKFGETRREFDLTQALNEDKLSLARKQLQYETRLKQQSLLQQREGMAMDWAANQDRMAQQERQAAQDREFRAQQMQFSRMADLERMQMQGGIEQQIQQQREAARQAEQEAIWNREVLQFQGAEKRNRENMAMKEAEAIRRAIRDGQVPADQVDDLREKFRNKWGSDPYLPAPKQKEEEKKTEFFPRPSGEGWIEIPLDDKGKPIVPLKEHPDVIRDNWDHEERVNRINDARQERSEKQKAYESAIKSKEKEVDKWESKVEALEEKRGDFFAKFDPSTGGKYKTAEEAWEASYGLTHSNAEKRLGRSRADLMIAEADLANHLREPITTSREAAFGAALAGTDPGSVVGGAVTGVGGLLQMPGGVVGPTPTSTPPASAAPAPSAPGGNARGLPPGPPDIPTFGQAKESIQPQLEQTIQKLLKGSEEHKALAAYMQKNVNADTPVITDRSMIRFLSSDTEFLMQDSNEDWMLYKTKAKEASPIP